MENMLKVLVVIEKGESSYGAYSPDIPGCFAVAETREEIEQLIQEALLSHITFLLEKKLPLPKVLVASYARHIWYQRWHALVAFLRTNIFSWELLFHRDTMKYVDVPLSVS